MGQKNKYYIQIGVIITHKMAKRLLGSARFNRDISKTRIKKYAAQIKAGKWAYPTGELIKIDTHGGAGDGQHRLGGIMLSGKSVKADIAYNIPEENFAYLDQQKVRSGADVLNIDEKERTGGVRLKYNTQIAAALQIVYAWFNTKDVYNTRHSINTLTNNELLQYSLSHQSIKKSAALIFSGERPLASPSVLIALHYILSKQRGNKDTADQFFSQFVTGENLWAKSPVLVLRNKFIQNKGEGKFKMTRAFMISCVLSAWHSHINGREMTGINYNANKLPQPILAA